MTARRPPESRFVTRQEWVERIDNLERLVKTHGVNGERAKILAIEAQVLTMAPTVEALKPVAAAADDLAELARDHREQKHLDAARRLIAEEDERRATEHQKRLMQSPIYRLGIGARKFLSDSGSKLYWAVIGGVGLWVATEWGPQLLGLASHVLLHSP